MQFQAFGQNHDPYTLSEGAIIRGNPDNKQLALIFTGHHYAEGGSYILRTLSRYGIKASFFFTGSFYRNEDFRQLILDIKEDGHYLGAHSDKHLLYCDWDNRDSLLVSKEIFEEDLKGNYAEMAKWGIEKADTRYFLPPYEWYNEKISQWTRGFGLQLINFTPGTRSNADYTDPSMANYVSSEEIIHSILDYEAKADLNGFLLLLHIGAGPERKDKFHEKLPELIEALQTENYRFTTVDQLLNTTN
ncbi:polysaccharide deacetylase family protein [Echinicola soli]|uniref:Polysaccharide deacetylase family protein n=2 Tax=Echinicola soli TaxID=2591634 RepID=A0A514CNZ0_9BACT|nr:polysaccharide deacetylase family protein [Echinicola soli]